mmetsp:Transcript_28435/g.40122  ORF Transcript_28435/g.40122 Transcript_28435/m.40122 type:complete len:146 (-) Transcript_28435:63-500(-)
MLNSYLFLFSLYLGSFLEFMFLPLHQLPSIPNFFKREIYFAIFSQILSLLCWAYLLWLILRRKVSQNLVVFIAVYFVVGHIFADQLSLLIRGITSGFILPLQALNHIQSLDTPFLAAVGKLVGVLLWGVIIYVATSRKTHDRRDD